MNSKRDFIIANQRVVQAHFTRQYGTEPGNIAYLEHQTRVGNVQSLQGLSLKCEKVASLARLATGASEGDMFELARFVSGDTAPNICAHPTAQAVVADAVVADTGAPPKVTATLAAEQAPGPEENLAAGHFVAEGPVTATQASAPASAKMIEVAEEKPTATAEAIVAPAPAPAPTAAQALQEAAKALALAATALQTQSASEPVVTTAVASQ